MRKTAAVAPTAALASLLAISAATPAVQKMKRIGQASASGEFAIATASGDATAPKAMYVRVIAKPAQKVSINWVVTCSRGFSAIASRTGQAEGRAPMTKKVKLPLSGRRDSCDIVASAVNDFLGPGGRIKIVLLAKI